MTVEEIIQMLRTRIDRYAMIQARTYDQVAHNRLAEKILEADSILHEIEPTKPNIPLVCTEDEEEDSFRSMENHEEI